MRRELVKLTLEIDSFFPGSFRRIHTLRRWPHQLPSVDDTIRVCSAESRLHLSVLTPHQGAIVERSIGEQLVKGCAGFLLALSTLNAFSPGPPTQPLWKIPKERDCQKVNTSPHPFSSVSPLCSSFSPPPLAPFFTNFNILINMAPLQGLHAVTAICSGSMGEFSSPF